MVGYATYLKVAEAVRLDVSLRQKDEETRGRLHRMRVGEVTSEDVAFVNGRARAALPAGERASFAPDSPR